MSPKFEDLVDRILFGSDHYPSSPAAGHSETRVETDSISQKSPSPQDTPGFAQGPQGTESNRSSLTVGPNSTDLKNAKNETRLRTYGLPKHRTRHRSRSRPLHPAVAYWKSLWRRDQHTWSPRKLQIRPLVGIVAIWGVIGCVLASLTVLLLSAGQATADWWLSPSTALAIITAVANSAITLAYMEAVPISWWYSMTRGRSIRALERQWQVSRSSIMVGITLNNEIDPN